MTVIYVARGNNLVGLIAVADALPPTSREAVRRLGELGIKVVMLTGDNWATARLRVGRSEANAEGSKQRRVEVGR